MDFGGLTENWSLRERLDPESVVYASLAATVVMVTRLTLTLTLPLPLTLTPTPTPAPTPITLTLTQVVWRLLLVVVLHVTTPTHRNPHPPRAHATHSAPTLHPLCAHSAPTLHLGARMPPTLPVFGLPPAAQVTNREREFENPFHHTPLVLGPRWMENRRPLRAAPRTLSLSPKP